MLAAALQQRVEPDDERDDELRWTRPSATYRRRFPDDNWQFDSDDSGDEAYFIATSRSSKPKASPLPPVDVSAVMALEDSLAATDLGALDADAKAAEDHLEALRTQFRDTIAAVQEALVPPPTPEEAVDRTTAAAAAAAPAQAPPPLDIPRSSHEADVAATSLELPADLGAPWDHFGSGVDPLLPVTACGATALHVASGNGTLAPLLGMLTKLQGDGRLERAAASVTEQGATSLHWAAMTGQAAAMALLLEWRAADPGARTALGHTAHDLAVGKGHAAAAGLLAGLGEGSQGAGGGGASVPASPLPLAELEDGAVGEEGQGNQSVGGDAAGPSGTGIDGEARVVDEGRRKLAADEEEEKEEKERVDELGLCALGARGGLTPSMPDCDPTWVPTFRASASGAKALARELLRLCGGGRPTACGASTGSGGCGSGSGSGRVGGGGNMRGSGGGSGGCSGGGGAGLSSGDASGPAVAAAGDAAPDAAPDAVSGAAAVVGAVKALLARGASAGACEDTGSGRTALHLACRCLRGSARRGVVAALLASGAASWARDRAMSTPLLALCAALDTPGRAADGVADNTRGTAVACGVGGNAAAPTASPVAQSDASAEPSDAPEEPPAEPQVVEAHDVAAARMLLEAATAAAGGGSAGGLAAAAMANARSARGFTALRQACGSALPPPAALVQLLLGAGADPALPDHRRGRTCLHAAALRGHAATAAALLSHGGGASTATTTAPDGAPALVAVATARGGATALHLAASTGDLAMASLLVEAGAPLAAAASGGTMAGETALACARRCGQARVAAFLAEAMQAAEAGAESKREKRAQALVQTTLAATALGATALGATALGATALEATALGATATAGNAPRAADPADPAKTLHAATATAAATDRTAGRDSTSLAGACRLKGSLVPAVPAGAREPPLRGPTAAALSARRKAKAHALHVTAALAGKAPPPPAVHSAGAAGAATAPAAMQRQAAGSREEGVQFPSTAGGDSAADANGGAPMGPLFTPSARAVVVKAVDLVPPGRYHGATAQGSAPGNRSNVGAQDEAQAGAHGKTQREGKAHGGTERGALSRRAAAFHSNANRVMAKENARLAAALAKAYGRGGTAAAAGSMAGGTGNGCSGHARDAAVAVYGTTEEARALRERGAAIAKAEAAAARARGAPTIPKALGVVSCATCGQRSGGLHQHHGDTYGGDDSGEDSEDDGVGGGVGGEEARLVQCGGFVPCVSCDEEWYCDGDCRAVDWHLSHRRRCDGGKLRTKKLPGAPSTALGAHTAFLADDRRFNLARYPSTLRHLGISGTASLGVARLRACCRASALLSLPSLNQLL